jgi:GH43 family beta-xylosidase
VGLLITIMNLAGFAQTFTNPFILSQDPRTTFIGGVYYHTYTGYDCADKHICMKSATTLTGLSTATKADLFVPGTGNPNCCDVWTPALFKVGSTWYIYYAADDGNINNHRMYAIQSSIATGPYTESSTGANLHGKILEPGDHLAIDPDLFTGLDGNLYMAFSCDSAHTIVLPTSVCLAEMSDALHISTATTILPGATNAWEKRGTPGINEAPRAYTWGNDTYIMFAASCVGCFGDYDEGIWVHYNDNGSNPSLLSGSWIKYGPIFDHHGTTQGPGSATIVPSVDGTERWAVYHGQEGSPCDPVYGCMNIRMQQVFFTPYGFPILGYPYNPKVALTDPSGEHGAGPGSDALLDWGAAYGDAAEGNPSQGAVVGFPILSTNLAGGATATSSETGTWNQAFRLWNPNVQNFTFSAQVQWVADTGVRSDFPKYGVYCSYDDVNNHAELFIDRYNNVLASHGVVAGSDQGWQNASIPSGFNPSQWHTLQCDKSGSTYTFTLDPGSPNTVVYSRTFNLANGQNGVVTDDTQANYQNVSATQYLTSQ